MKQKIRVAQRSDLEQIVAIEQQCFTDGRIERRQFRYLMERGQSKVWVVADEYQLLGYAVYLFPKQPRRARLYSLAVAREHRGLGIGTSLLCHGLRVATQAGYHAMALEVRCDQLQVQSLYKTQGFRWTHLLFDYYGEEVDGWKMVCALPQTFEVRPLRDRVA